MASVAASDEVQHRRAQARGEHCADRRTSVLARGQEHDQRDRRLGRGRQPQAYRGDHAERALRADEQTLEVIPRDVLRGPAADLHELARRKHHLHARDPGAGDAVLERVRAAGVGGDVAADLRLLGCARIRREEQPVLARQALHVARADAGLGEHAPQRRLELADAAQPLQRAHDSALSGHGAAEQARAAATRHDRHVVLVAPRDHLRDLLCAAWQHHGVRAPLDAPAVGAVVVVRRLRRGLEHVLGADQLAELAVDRSTVAGHRRGRG